MPPTPFGRQWHSQNRPVKDAGTDECADQSQDGELGPMPHPKGAIWTERLLLGFILATLGGTLNLIVAVNRHAAIPAVTQETAIDSAMAAPSTSESQSPSVASSSELPEVQHVDADGQNVANLPNSQVPLEPLPAEDPTKQAVARLSTAM